METTKRLLVLLFFLLGCGIARAACETPSAALKTQFPSPQWEVISFTELKKFTTIWAMSDPHGHLEEIKRLLLQAGLIAQLADSSEKDGSRLAWNPQKRRDLVIIVGDLIDDGEDSVGLVLFLDRLKKEAARVGSRIIITLGNHEARFLRSAEKNVADRDLLDSADLQRDSLVAWNPGPACNALKINLRGNRVSADELAHSHFGCYLKNLPLGAIAGDFLFAHSGYFAYSEMIYEDLEPMSLPDFVTEMTREKKADNFDVFGDDQNPLSSLITRHNWWRNLMPQTHEDLKCLGLSGLAMGHQSSSLMVEEENEIAINRGGWMLKLDSGLKKLTYTKKDDFHKGRILKCATKDIIIGKGTAQTIRMMKAGQPVCRQIGQDKTIKKGDLMPEKKSNIEVDNVGEPLMIAPAL